MKKILIASLLTLIGITNTYATHLMGGEISYLHVGGDNYEVTLKVYRDCSGVNLGNSFNVSFQSSCVANFSVNFPLIQTVEVSQLCPTQVNFSTCNGGILPGTQQFIYQAVVTMVPCSDWKIFWSSGNRNPAITNLVGPGSTSIFIMATLDNVVGAGNSSPQYLTIPTPYLCSNTFTIFNHGAADPDGDSLYYQLAQPLTTPGPPGVLIPFAVGYTVLDPIITSGGMNLNPETGEMCFTPIQGQICVVSVLVSEYRNNNLIGTQIREMQVVVDAACTNQPPVAGGVVANCGLIGGMVITTQGPNVTQIDSNSIVMCPGDSICFEVNFSDFDVTDNLTVTSNVATAIPGATFTIIGDGTPNATAIFCWVPTPLDSGLNVITILVEDDHCPITSISTYTYDITVFDQPSAGPDQTICGAQAAQLLAQGGGGYVWSVISGDPINVGTNFSCNNCDNPIATPAITTTYLLTSSLVSACANTDTVTVFVVPDFNESAVPDTSVCVFSGVPVPVVLNVTPDSIGYTYDWNNGATLNDSTIATPTASPLVTTDYEVVITSPFGCVKTDTATITVVNVSALSITGTLTACLGDSTTLTATFGAGYTYLWTPGNDTTQSIQADSGQYIVEFNANGCIARDTVNVAVVDVSKPIIADTAFCEGDTVFVNVLGGPYNSYTWNPSAGVTPLGGITIGGNYTVTVDSLGCSITSDTILVTENPMPLPIITGNSFYCQNSTNGVSLSAQNGFNSYLWSPTGSVTTTTTAGSGLVTVTVTDAIGCIGTDTMTIFSSNPQALIVGADSICPNEFDTLTVTPSFSAYLWSNGDTNDSTASSLGNISVIVTDNFGCTDTAYATIYSHPVPSADFTIDPLPQGQPLVQTTFTDNSSGSNIVSWNWNFGDGFFDNNQNTVHIYDVQGIYPVTLTVTNDYGCSSSKTVDYLVLSDITIPNVFTPNGDGSNDFLVFKNVEYYENHVVVYNRWGLKVFEKDNYVNDWDGDNLNDGTYFFILEVNLPGAEGEVYRGSVTLLR